MQEIDLKISKKDWATIFFIGVVFSVVITSLLYFLLQKPFLHGVVFGMMLGAAIVLLSMLFITYINRWILPKLYVKYWIFLAAFFSFFSGFLGTVFSFYIARSMQLDLIEKFEQNLFTFAFILGLLTYMIGWLLYQFVRMSNQKEHSNKMLVASRLKSLETQLNPHFLHNSLNSLAELIHYDKDKAEILAIKLSKFLRSSMKECPLISLEKELENLNHYLYLENIRFDNKITLHTNCNKALHTKMIPKFSIQLLVENAIKHSFVNSNKEFMIYLTISKHGELTHIEIENSGKGVVDKSFGIGLNNLNERLKLLCDGHVSLVSKENSRYKMVLGECDENTTS